MGRDKAVVRQRKIKFIKRLNMKKVIVMAIMSLMAIGANAQEYSLYVQSVNGETGYELKQLQKLTFENGKIVITKKDGTVAQATSLSDITKMYFSADPSGINTPAKDEAIEENVVKGTYDLSGRRILNVDKNALPKGVYIVDGKKIAVK